MQPNEDKTTDNRHWWDERAAFHRNTPLYQEHITRLKGGDVCLLPLDLQELGSVDGLNVLHLQCHIGTDTLSLARLGATVTGVDFSEVAIREARQLSEDLGIPASFERHDIHALSPRFSNRFDRVFTSHGVLGWLPDLHVWAEQIAHCLVSGGQLYLSESHPLVWAFADEQAVQETTLQLEHPYLAQDQPMTFSEAGSYADPTRSTAKNRTVEWSWGLGDVVNALLGAGLRIDSLKEHPLGFYPVTKRFERRSDGHYQLPAPLHGRFPLTFTLRASKP